MKYRYLLVIVTVLFVTQAYAQRSQKGSYNRLGIQAGAQLFDINTDNFITNKAVGFTGGFTTRGSFYNYFDLIYGVDFFDLNLDILARETVAADVEEIPFSVFAIQLNFLGSYNIIDQHLSIEFGPVLQINSKLTTEDQFEDYIIEGYNTLRARDIEDITKINGNVVLGLTAGLKNIRLWARYQYGFNNILNGLNDEGLDQVDPSASSFEGHMSLLTAGLVFYL